MAKISENDQMPLVGFFPLFYNLAESGRAVLVAKRFVELGGRVVFFSHGGRYEKLAEDAGFRVVRCTPLYSDELVQHIVQVNRGEKKGIAYSESFIRESVESEKQAFLDEGAIQCGYCTPGMILTTVALLNENPHPSDEQIIEWMNGNLCRCNGYTKIMNAIRRAAANLAEVNKP